MLKSLIIAALAAGTLISDGVPPARFQRDAVAQVWFVSPGAVDLICDQKGLGFNVVACSYPAQRKIIVPNPCLADPREYYGRMLCHELGHINGWPGNHTP